MKIPITENLSIETGKISQTNDRISIEFWDPSKPLNRCIIDRADLLTFREINIIANYQRTIGQTEMKIRRAGQFRPSGDELEGTEAYYEGLQEQTQNMKTIIQEIRREDAADLRRYLDRTRREEEGR